MVKHKLLEEMVKELKATKAKVWIRVASELLKPTRNKPEVNLSKLEKYGKEGFTLIVPGKVLGTGTLTKKVNVASYQYSQSAHDKIKANGGTIVSIQNFAKKNKDGKKVILLK
jgi:large subunit ribosomal protein L18e